MNCVRATATLLPDGSVLSLSHTEPSAQGVGKNFEEARKKLVSAFYKLSLEQMAAGFDKPRVKTTVELFSSPDYVVGGIQGKSVNFDL